MSPPAAEQNRYGRVEDARAHVVSQLDPVMMHVLHRHGGIPADRLAAVAREVGVGLTRANRLLLWPSVVGLVCLSIAIAIVVIRYARGTIQPMTAIRSLGPFIAVMVTFNGSWIATKQARLHRAMDVMPRHRR
jgi:hypothetical protein